MYIRRTCIGILYVHLYYIFIFNIRYLFYIDANADLDCENFVINLTYACAYIRTESDTRVNNTCTFKCGTAECDSFCNYRVLALCLY